MFVLCMQHDYGRRYGGHVVTVYRRLIANDKK